MIEITLMDALQLGGIVLAYLAIAFRDGRLTPDEIAGLVTTSLRAALELDRDHVEPRNKEKR